ncbi:methyl-accepting chemotaxis sensory transducer with Cache sensor [Geothermobacter ehrlichii]|uniref:Methyl-accepting chemotaxis sensory transducer with Cache sensor n=1 Tax=Geothermobacter ehrlichii TaxID=213224 RepID=A0A5D3WI24_9BACT|nr:methyl-accepting chemotaxis protein [Geothermobacter ehrlichii]TYO98472.1 methyl-accepting chemotaxis sensory transducer with Cache sensor [Geothermobacter ehrlichii]
MSLKNLSIGSKIYLVSGLLILIFTTCLSWIYVRYRDQVWQGSRQELAMAVDTAWGIVDHYSKQAGEELSVSEAQMLAKSAIRNLRFDNNLYFWINDTTPAMIMHPIKPQLEGKNLANVKDPNGKHLFREMVQVTSKDGAGFVQYQWPKPGQEKPTDKLSYVRKHPGWGWIIGAGIYLDDLQSRISHAFWTIIGGLALAIVASIVLVFFLARHVSRPLHQTVEMIEEMERGHLDMRLNLNDRKDEMGRMARAMDAFADSLQNEMVASLQKLANGDLDFSITPRDDKDVLRHSLKKLEMDLNSIMSEIQHSGEQIAIGADQVSGASQSLSRGATESAASLEQIAASLLTITEQIQKNASNADKANHLSSQAQKAAEDGNSEMESMLAAMNEIAEAGQNINKIIKTIDEIAFQTNLLALNAAVEAARAGQHGKGFAVVAEEVRNLAARSARAARETAELIEGSVELTDKGTDIANKTAKALERIVGSITEVSDLVADIATASNEQAEGINQINIGLTQIDHVTQQNSATAEETAASSQELSSQVSKLQQMLRRFRPKSARAKEWSVPQPTRAVTPSPKTPPAPAAAASTTAKESVIQLDDSEFDRY